MSTEIVLSSFEKLNLSKEHAKVYLASLELGKVPASMIARKAQIARSSTYGLLADLQKLGLISGVKEETKKVFSPTSPIQIDFLLKQKQQEINHEVHSFEESLSSLMGLFSNHQSKLPKVRFHEGEFGLKTVYFDCLSADELLVFCQGNIETNTSLKDDPKYLKDFIEEAERRNLKTREILQDNPAVREYKEKYESEITKVVIIPENKDNNFGHVDKHIYGNKIAYISHDNMIGVIIEDETLAAHERAQFEMIWNSLKSN